MALKRKSNILYIALLLLCITFIYAYKWITDEEWRYHSRINQANHVIAQIEEFKASNARLPRSLEEIEKAQDVNAFLFYEPREDGYSIWFGTVLGESMTYESTSRKWRKTIDE